MANKTNETSEKEFNKDLLDRTPVVEDPAYEKADVNEYSKSEVVNDVVDQETGEVKKGQPGGTAGESASNRPTLTEDEARRVNGYAGFNNIGEYVAATTPDADEGDKLVEKA